MSKMFLMFFVNITHIFAILMPTLEVNLIYNYHKKYQNLHISRKYLFFFKALISSMYLATALFKFYESFIEKIVAPKG